MNVRSLASLLVVALFTLPLIAPLISAIPVSAQVAPLEVTSFVVTPGGELGFILNRTVLIAGHPVQGAPVLYLWASKNPDTSLTGDEFLLATLSVGTATGVVFGTLLVNETIGAWLGDGEASIYLKVNICYGAKLRTSSCIKRLQANRRPRYEREGFKGSTRANR